VTGARALPTLTGAYNFRDLGGLPTVHGGQVVSGAIFRSDALDELTGDDVQVLCDVIGLGSVIDLRAHLETQGRPPEWAAGRSVDFLALPLSNDWMRSGGLDQEGSGTLMARTYMGYLEAAGANVVAALERIAENAGRRPTVFHCAAGKDRTGVLAAVLLSILGVTRAGIVRDYRVSADSMERILARLAASSVYRDRIRTTSPEVFRADEHTMEMFLDWLEERFGGAERWAVTTGLDPAALRRLRERLTEGDAA
jgi:protein-tyrosine phosphatase